MRDFALGGALLGGLSAVYFYAYAAVQIPVGVLLDRFGARRLLIVGTLLAAAGSALFALAPGLALALAGRALVGAAVGFAFIATLKIVTLWFPPQRFGRMAGWTLAVGIVGGSPRRRRSARWWSASAGARRCSRARCWRSRCASRSRSA